MEVQAADFENLVEIGDVAPNYVIVSDGSGCQASHPFGWFAAIYSWRSRKIKQLSGGGTNGTNNLAEVMPFLHSLWYLESRYPNPEEKRQVLCVSDSLITCQIGNAKQIPRSNVCLWAGINELEKRGLYYLTWKHVPRNSNPINKLADKIAGESRKLFLFIREAALAKEGDDAEILLRNQSPAA